MRNDSWSTRSEIDFLKHLGMAKWSSESSRVMETTREDMLERYLAGANTRHEWNNIDRDEVIEFAFDELMNERRGMK